MLKFYNSYLLVIIMAIFFMGCVSAKKIVYFQDEEGIAIEEEIENYEPTIQYGDILAINVSSSIAPEVAEPFNIYEGRGDRLAEPLTYIVNAAGEIIFPAIGKLEVAGFTTREVTDRLTKLLLVYMKDPIVNLRITNFKISVLGEVTNPGVYAIENERVTILEALGLAGDLNIQGKRKNVTLIREQNGQRKSVKIDLTSKYLFDSPYFYLAQNDIIYVEPNKARVNSSNVSSNTSVILTSFSILISIIAIVLR